MESDWCHCVVMSLVWLYLKISICIPNTLIIDAICILLTGRNTLDKLYSVIGRLRHLSLSVFVTANVISPYVAPVVNPYKRSDSLGRRNLIVGEGTISCSMGHKNLRS